MFNGLRLLRAECLRVFGDVKNYWFNYLLGNLNVFFMFFGLFFTFPKNQGASLDKLLFLFGLMYWYFGTHAIDLVSLLMEEEIEQGTLEQLLMTRVPLAISFGFRIAAQVLFDLCKGVLFYVCGLLGSILRWLQMFVSSFPLRFSFGAWLPCMAPVISLPAFPLYINRRLLWPPSLLR